MVDSPSQWTKRAMMAAGLLVIALSAAVLVGWYIHFIPLIQVIPTQTPTHRMTALAYLLSGCALVLTALGRKRATGFLALVVFILAVAVCLEYVLGADFGIDEVLGRDYLKIRTSNPGRMSPASAICFIATSLALFTASSSRLSARLASGIVGLVATVLIAVGAVSALSDLLLHREIYGWGRFTRMSLQTSISFALLGVGLLAWAWQKSRAKGAPKWLPLTLGVGIAAGALGLWQALMTHEERHMPLLSAINLAGDLLCAVLVAVVVAQMQRAQQRGWDAQKSNMLLQQLFDLSPDGLVMTDRRGTIIRVNEEAEKIFGYAPGELLKQPIERLIPEKLSELHRAHREDYHAAPSPRRMGNGFELHARRKDLSEFPVEIGLTELQSPEEGVLAVAMVRDITERKLSEEALRESEGAFVMLANCVPQMVWTCRPDGLNVYFNQRWVEYTGLTLEESYGRGWNTPFHPDDKQAAWEAWNQATTTGGTYLVESRLRAADGRYRWFLMRGVPVHDAAGNIVKWFGTCTDIDDLKRAEQKLQESEARLRLQIDRMPIGCIVFSKDLHILSWNPAAEQIFGFSAKEVIGRHPYDCIVPPKLQPQIDSIAARLVQGDETAQSTNENLTKDGRRITCEWTNTPLRGADGTVYGLLSMIQDITERKRGEENLRQSEERFRGVFEQGQIGVTLMGMDRRMFMVNATMCRMLGYSEEELTRMTPLDITYPDDKNLSADLMEHLFDRNFPVGKVEKRYVRKNGEIMWGSLTASVIRDREGNPLYSVGLIEDITERKQAETELRLGNEIFANMEEGVCLVRIDDGIIVHTNPRFSTMFGYGPDELTGAEVTRINADHPQRPEEVAEEIRAAIRRSGVWRGEILHKRKDGTLFWCAVTVSLFQHPKFGGVGISVHQDITELKQVQETVRESEERFRGIFEQGPIGVALLGLDHRMTKVNPAFCRMLGYTEAELAKMTPLDMTFPDDRESCMGLLGRLDKGEIPVCTMEKRYVKKSGELMWVSLTASVIRDQEGRPLHGLGMIEDITKRKRAEEELRILTQRLSLATRSAAMGVWELNLGSEHAIWDETMFQIMGLPKKASIEREDWARQMHPDDLAKADAFIEVIIREKTQARLEFRVVRPDGLLRYVSTAGGAVLDAHGNVIGVVGIAFDITQSRQAEQKLAEQAALLDLARDCIAVRDMEGRIIFWNRGAKETYGWSADEAVGRASQELLQTKSPVPLNEIEATVLTQGAWEGELEQSMRDGKRIFLASRWSLWRDEHGAPKAFLVINRDITARKHTEEQLHSLTERLALATRSASIGVWDWDLRTNTTLWDDTLFDMFRIKKVVPMAFEDFTQRVHPDDLSKVHASLERAITGKTQDFVEFRIIRPDGSLRHIAAAEGVVLDEQGKVVRVVGTGVDITERKQMEEQIEA
ncbi:hypothetical protein AYO50_01420, partial [Acidobacteria bacterium SCGC AG-212-P17]